MTNIYQINSSSLEQFIKYNHTNKVVLYYKTSCGFCSIEIDYLNDLSKIYNSHIEYAICDITKAKEFCLSHNITKVPTIHFYQNEKLYKEYDSLKSYEDLEQDIKILNEAK